jgi:hypothetical protein
MTDRFSILLVFTLGLLIPLSLSGQDATTIEVSRMILCSGIENKEPSSDTENFDTDVGKIYCFTEIMNAVSPTTVTHRWFKDGKLMADVPLRVHGDRYRTWSSKQIITNAPGEWMVEVVDEAGNKLSEKVFRISALDDEKLEEPAGKESQ